MVESTKTKASKVRIRVEIGKTTPYSNNTAKIQNPKNAGIFDPLRPSVAPDLSPPNGVARNGTDARDRKRLYMKRYCRKRADLEKIGDDNLIDVKELARAADKTPLAQSGFSMCEEGIQTIM